MLLFLHCIQFFMQFCSFFQYSSATLQSLSSLWIVAYFAGSACCFALMRSFLFYRYSSCSILRLFCCSSSTDAFKYLGGFCPRSVLVSFLLLSMSFLRYFCCVYLFIRLLILRNRIPCNLDAILWQYIAHIQYRLHHPLSHFLLTNLNVVFVESE